MNDKTLLMSTRLKMPQPRRNYIVRKELFFKLDSMNGYSIILIIGCAGSGKTTLITSFAKERNISKFKWLSLDESCNNIFMFWNYFIETVGEYIGDRKQKLLELFGSNFQKSDLERILIFLINELNIEKDIFIVLDDFYYIQDKLLIRTIDFFIENISENVHLIILTRHETPLYLATINMEGRLLIIDEKELKFSEDAGISFLKDTMKLKLKQETMDYINDICEGWVGGLQLIAAATFNKNETEIINLKIENRLIKEYLTKEIYEFLEEDQKRFLIVTSILSYFNEDICNALLKDIDFNKMIDSLLLKNILVICIDDKDGIYRYHNILKEYLEIRFKSLSKKTKIQYHLNCADILKKLGDYNQCIEQLLKAEDYNKAMVIILEQHQNVMLSSYVDRIPKGYAIKNVDFAYQSFFYYLVNLEYEKCRELYNMINTEISEDLTFPAFKFSNMFVEDTVKLNEVNILSISEIDKMPLKETTKAFILIKDAYFLYAQSRFEDALNFIDKASSYPISRNNDYIAFFSLCTKSQVLEDMGELSECIKLYRQISKMISCDKDCLMFNANFYIGITGVYIKQMKLNEAQKSLISAKQYIFDKIDSVDRGYRYNLAEYKFIIGETDEAIELATDLIKDTLAYNNPIYIAPLLKYIFKIKRLSKEIMLNFTEGYKNTNEKFRSLDSKLLYANILFSQGEVGKAIEINDEILKYSRMNKIKLKMVEASLSKINMIYGNLNKKREVINLFREAIFYSYRDSILGPYYFEREIVIKIISRYTSEICEELSPLEKEHYKEIERLCGVSKKSILSEREIDVLNEISKGKSNKEIAETLYISMATVKTHIINIYSKLNVSNRVEAAKKAKEIIT